MPQVHHVKSARKADPGVGIKVGDEYYWWRFRFGPKVKSKTPPRRSQLTRSDFLQQIYELLDQEPDREGLEDWVQNLVSELEPLREECESRLDNMPEQLRDSSDAGMTLQDRIEQLEGWTSTLESIDFSRLEDEELTEEGRDEILDEIVEEIHSAEPGF